MIVRPATPADEAAIREVVCAAFGQSDEALLVDILRRDGDALVELVAEADGQVVGHILFSPMAAEPAMNVAALAPMAVRPVLQCQGIGSKLVREGLDACRARGVEAVIVLGHPEYYPRFGFSAEAAETIEAPFDGPAFMALSFTGALPRKVGYAPAFGL